VTVETERDLVTRYANIAGGWLGLSCVGIETGADGALRLQSIPDPGVAAGPIVPALVGDAPAGCALDECGAGYISLPATGRVLVVTRCEPRTSEAGEIVGRRADDTELLPGAFTCPRGLAIGPRGRLYVADSDTVAVVDVRSGAVTARWAGFTDAWCVAASGEDVYVLDRGGAGGIGRVQCFDADGVVDAAFATTVGAAVTDPIRVAANDEALFVVSREAARDVVVVVAHDGSVQPSAAWADPARTERDPISGSPSTTEIERIRGIAADSKRVYLVDQDHYDLVSFTTTGSYIGSTHPARPLADVWLAGWTMWGYPSEAGSLSRHIVDGGRLRSGTFVCGPIDTATAVGRRELRVRIENAAGGHVRLWTAVTSGNVKPSPSDIPITDAPSATAWSALPVDIEAALVPNPAGPLLFIGGQISGSGTSTPAVHQIGVGGSRPWLNLLPAVYRKDVAQSDFLDRYLRLVHSVQEETAQERADLVRRFDAWIADDSSIGRGSVLDELAGWLDLALDERGQTGVRRSIVANEFVEQALRGTPRGLLKAIEARLTGSKVQLSEPAQRARIWALGESSTPNTCGCHGEPSGLGFDTMIVAGPADGAVVGASAFVGQSELTGGKNVGAPLFDDLAHRFHVCALPAPGTDAAGVEVELRQIVEGAKPAHTVYTLCVGGPRARVGLQARVGIDLIVAPRPEPVVLDDITALDAASLGPPALATDDPEPAYVGQLRVGVGRLT
jgi:phage tail-like protein